MPSPFNTFFIRVQPTVTTMVLNVAIRYKDTELQGQKEN